ncbi:MAG: patatin-like phospholipase family protein [Bryobacteraceae bacterium]|nr:patatin-like phospholipase family protein [Bryobacteraceae bacterium]
MTEKTALVLSAGGMFGAYQAGVWDVLSGAFKPDLVVGASVGSLNGWLIASGISPSSLVDRWLNLEQMSRIRWRLPRSLFDGVLDSSALENTIREMCSADALQTDFGVVLTKIPDLRATLFRAPEVEWRHIASSCAVPFFLTHHQIEGSFYSDGGLVDPLPIWAAIEMGATRIVCINLLKVRPWYIHGVVRAVQAWGKYTESSYAGVRIVEIAPRQSLGSTKDSMYWTRENAERWILQGREDAESAVPAVVECLEWGPGRGLPDSGESERCSSTTFTV